MRPTALTMPTETFVRSARNVRPTATAHWPARISSAGASAGTGKSADAGHLQQHQHPAVVGGHELGRRLLAGREGDQNRRRLLHEVERAGNDVAVGEITRPVVGPSASKRAVDGVEAADRANLHDRIGDAFGRGTQVRLLRERRANASILPAMAVTADRKLQNAELQNANCEHDRFATLQCAICDCAIRVRDAFTAISPLVPLRSARAFSVTSRNSSPRSTAMRTVGVAVPVARRARSASRQEAATCVSIITTRSSGRSPARAAGESGSTRSMYGGVRVTTSGTSTMPSAASDSGLSGRSTSLNSGGVNRPASMSSTVGANAPKPAARNSATCR